MLEPAQQRARQAELYGQMQQNGGGFESGKTHGFKMSPVGVKITR
jgi:hypothetical protein